MKLHVDKGADALYLRIDDSGIVDSREVSPGISLDYNESGEVVGVEMLHLSKRSGQASRWPLSSRWGGPRHASSSPRRTVTACPDSRTRSPSTVTLTTPPRADACHAVNASRPSRPSQ